MAGDNNEVVRRSIRGKNIINVNLLSVQFVQERSGEEEGVVTSTSSCRPLI